MTDRCQKCQSKHGYVILNLLSQMYSQSDLQSSRSHNPGVLNIWRKFPVLERVYQSIAASWSVNVTQRDISRTIFASAWFSALFRDTTLVEIILTSPRRILVTVAIPRIIIWSRSTTIQQNYQIVLLRQYMAPKWAKFAATFSYLLLLTRYLISGLYAFFLCTLWPCTSITSYFCVCTV